MDASGFPRLQGWLNGWEDLAQDRCRGRGETFLLGMMVGLLLFIPMLDLEDQNPLRHFPFSGVAFFGMCVGGLMSIRSPKLKVSSFIKSWT